MTNDSFTEDQLIAALMGARKETESDPAALTVREMEEVTGIGTTSIARRLRALIIADDVVAVRKRFVRIDNVVTTVPAYRLQRQDDNDNTVRGVD